MLLTAIDTNFIIKASDKTDELCRERKIPMKSTARICSAILALVLVLALGSVSLAAAPAFDKAQISPQSVIVNGENVALEVYNIDGSNYFKLRDVAMLLSDTESGFSVDYDAEKRVMLAETGEGYVPVGGELAVGEDRASTAVVSEWTLRVDGAAVECNIYNIGGNNFFKLRDLGSAFGFDVDYNAALNAAVISSIDWYEANVDVFSAGDGSWTIDELKQKVVTQGRHDGVSYRGVRVSSLTDELPETDENVSIFTLDGQKYNFTGKEWASAVVIFTCDGERIADTFGNKTSRIRLAIGGELLQGFESAQTDPAVVVVGERTVYLSELKAMHAVSGKAANGTTYTGVKLVELFESLPPAAIKVTVETYDGSVNAKGNTYTGAQLAEAVLAYECSGAAVEDAVEADGEVNATYVRLIIGGDVIKSFSGIRYGE